VPATDQFFRKLSTMHVVFAISSLVMFGVTIWMMAADHNDEWRVWQTEFSTLEAEKNRADQDARKTELAGSPKEYEQKKRALKQERDRKTKKLETQNNTLPRLQSDVQKISRDIDMATRLVRNQRAHRDVARANYDLGIRDDLHTHNLEKLQRRKNIFDNQQAEVDQLELNLEQKEVKLGEKLEKLSQVTNSRDQTEAELKSLTTDIELMHAALIKLEPNGLSWAKRRIMEWPIIDGFNSHHKLINDWLPDLRITLGMTESVRFDRCRSCHQGVDRTGTGNVPNFPFGRRKEGRYPHPFATHPWPDVYVSSTSPHPAMDGPLKFGCTVCHDGQGSGTSFSNASHTPNNPHQEEVWHEKYHYASNHFWEYPMFPKRFRESTCLKCHHTVLELGVSSVAAHEAIRKNGRPTAPKVYKGWQIIRTMGCFGCHEIRGFDAGKPIGPDLRLEPNYNEAALHLLRDPAFNQLAGNNARKMDRQSNAPLREMRELALRVVEQPAETNADRRRLQALIQEDEASKEPLLTMQAHALEDVFDDVNNPGTLRKVGPSLRSVGQKTTRGWLEYWIEEPQRFRPSTRMPQFFHLSNMDDAVAHRLTPVEIAAVAQFLIDKSGKSIDKFGQNGLMTPMKDYKPDPARGAELFSRRGCLACHSHRSFPDPDNGLSADFAPDLSRIFEKIRSGREGFNWLYTWISDPQRHHPRSRMPNLFLSEGEPPGVNAAADIAAFLLTPSEKKDDDYKDPRNYKLAPNDSALNELVELYLKSVLAKPSRDAIITGGHYPEKDPEKVKGDEIELVGEPVTRRMKLNYVGRRTISRYGCYGCHDIPGFERARSIGTTLQDWGRKDTTKLAIEHIKEFLDRSGEPDGNSTRNRVDKALKRASAEAFISPEQEEREMAAAFFYESLLHHGRPGFAWQKLRDPRSYDYKKIGTKRYDERLRMPKFPLDEQQIEAVVTFLLGLVAEPPSEQYLYDPGGAAAVRIKGEQLLQKYNCIGCHMVELPKVTYAPDADALPYFSQLGADDYPEGFELLMELKPPRDAETGETLEFEEDGKQRSLSIISFRGLVALPADLEEDPEDQITTYSLWETVKVKGKLLRPSANLSVPTTRPRLVDVQPARGGRFAEWLVAHLAGDPPNPESMARSWQQAPPPLYLQGIKVQTPWLFQFLKNPHKIRHTIVLRMPRFNMSDAEAHVLANYFAAVDGVPFPYQEIPQREPDYLTAKAPNYLNDSWNLLNDPGLCIKCHSVGGKQVQVSNSKTDIRGPNLEYVPDRLRPKWTMLWLYSPNWLTTYTSMPKAILRSKPVEGLFGGDGNSQNMALRDALMNYHRLMERDGTVVDAFKPITIDKEFGD